MSEIPTFAPAHESHMRSGGPFFDDLVIGQSVTAPAVTLTSGIAATHQSILADRVPMALDAELSEQLTGRPGQIAAPSLAWNISIGQSTHFTQRAKANLFYRGLIFRALPHLGDTLHTRTEVVGLRDNRRRDGRYPTGVVGLRISTVDQTGRTILDYTRCAMLPLSSVDVEPAHNDDLDAIGGQFDTATIDRIHAGWNTGHLPITVPVAVGDHWTVANGDVVSSAPELARLTLNLAAVHHDFRATGGSERLVYGGHTIGLAHSQLTRTVPGILAVVGWRSCDHLAPVREGDTLASSFDVEDVRELGNDARAVSVRVLTQRFSQRQPDPVDVLDWRVEGIQR